MRVLVVGPDPPASDVAARLESLEELQVDVGDPDLGDLVTFIAAEHERFDTVFFLGHAYPVTTGAVALVSNRAVLVPLVEDEVGLDAKWRSYVFRLPRAHGYRTLAERELVRQRVDIEAVPFEVLGRDLGDRAALGRLLAPRTGTDQRCVVLYRKGPRWDNAKPLVEQTGVSGHLRFMGRSVARGVIERAGAFHDVGDMVGDDLVGLVVFATDDPAEVERALDYDPALRAGVMEAEIRRWRL